VGAVLEGKVAVVTGASSGSGLGIARRFVEEGATVVMLARGSERLEQTAKDLGAEAIPIVADVGDPGSVGQAFSEIGDRFGRVDILVNNAAVYRPCRVELLSDLDIDQQMRTNFAGPVYTCRAAIPLLRAAGGGDIVNTSSESTLHPFPMLSMYVATKAALEAFAVVLAQEVRDDDIRVTTVIQGGTNAGGGGSTGWEWDPEHGAAAIDLWTRTGLISQAFGRNGGQEVTAVGDVHVFVVTRPRTQKMDTVYCRSF
jgi:NAD(P)-dependent dehydrogenase (short-subunit alcohol dehydrogenase family)